MSLLPAKENRGITVKMDNNVYTAKPILTKMWWKANFKKLEISKSNLP
jgi:hypothetical protein